MNIVVTTGIVITINSISIPEIIIYSIMLEIAASCILFSVVPIDNILVIRCDSIIIMYVPFGVGGNRWI